MAIFSRSSSISPSSVIQLYKGKRYFAPTEKGFFTSRAVPYTSLRILCRVKWMCKRPGVYAVSREHVEVRIKSKPYGGLPERDRAKEEVREIIAKALETSKSQVSVVSSPLSKVRDLIMEYSPDEKSFMGNQPEKWVSLAKKKLEEKAMKD
ncbi:hypothetical protein PG993_000821 [Apiospora rasikravindrae]|uniref:Uncharacterized protein n=1 Tax=Apiospora rasikravindrae TaxID=990691 RepID=A0ABR1UCF5_9PEZI